MNIKNKLLFWTPEFNVLVKDWLKSHAPDILDEFNYSILLEKEILYECGKNSYLSHPTGVQDRKGEHGLYNVSALKWIPYEEQPKQSFAECMFESAQSIADKGKTIDFFWSGGLDSTAMLIAFNELGLEKQLHVIMGGEPEEPELFEKIIKGRMRYTLDETATMAIYGIAKPDENVWTSGVEADILLGATSGGGARDNKFRGNPLAATPRIGTVLWKYIRRYNISNRLYRMVANFDSDWVDINNHSSFYTHESIEKWVINHMIAGDMVHWDIGHEGWGDRHTWQRNAGYNDLAPSQKRYLKCKMPLRDFIYDITKDKSLSYQKVKNLSEMRLKWEIVSDGEKPIKKNKLPFRNIAFTGDGNVITRENFNDYDWLSYIANRGNTK